MSDWCLNIFMYQTSVTKLCKYYMLYKHCPGRPFLCIKIKWYTQTELSGWWFKSEMNVSLVPFILDVLDVKKLQSSSDEKLMGDHL